MTHLRQIRARRFGARLGIAGLLAVAMITSACRPPSQGKGNVGADDAANAESAEPKKAGVGVGKSSQAMDRHQGPGGAVASPARTLFRTKEKIVFEIQIPHALNLYKAEHGKGPQSHEEFMEKIIRRNRIELPELPPGQHYQFDVEKQELWVMPNESSP